MRPVIKDHRPCPVVLHQTVSVSISEHQQATVLVENLTDSGTVVAWGNPNNGGDISAVKDKLQNVRCLKASSNAFAAILQDGHLI